MARTLDAARPTVTVDTHPQPWAKGRLVVALERLPQNAYVWDDDDPTIVWADLGGGTGPELVWDAPSSAGGFTDVWCDMSSLQIVHGEPDNRDMYAVSRAQLELVDPGDGRYRTRTVDGRLVYYATGRRLSIWWKDPAGVDWWLFNGRLATWRERLDNTVAIEAYSGDNLGAPPGVSYSPGSAGQTFDTRTAAILTAAAYRGTYRADIGTLPLDLPAAAETPALDLIRQAAWSDGGIVYTDADDTLIVRDRYWRAGRTDQPTPPILTDNVCDTGGIVVWDPQAADDDLRLAGKVRLENSADPPLVSVATGAPPTSWVDPAVVFTHPGADLWQTQAAGDALAAHILGERQTARLALGYAALYMHDRRFDYWARVMNMRLGDLVRFVHQDTFTTDLVLYDLNAVLTTLRHTITPDAWLVELQTSPAVGYTAVQFWDQTSFVWDAPDPGAVWR